MDTLTIDVVAIAVEDTPAVTWEDDIPLYDTDQPKIQAKRPSELDPRPPLPMVHSLFDDYGLDVYEFRIYSHIVRRTGGKLYNECFATLKKMATMCKMSVRKAQYALAALCEAKFIEKVPRRGRTDIYKLKPMSEWKSKDELTSIRKRIKNKK